MPPALSVRKQQVRPGLAALGGPAWRRRLLQQRAVVAARLRKPQQRGAEIVVRDTLFLSLSGISRIASRYSSTAAARSASIARDLRLTPRP
jgi:hypothetical protein